MRPATSLGAVGFVALMAFAGCSSAGRTAGTVGGSGTVAPQPPITVTTVSPAPNNSSSAAGATGSDSDQISAVESDLGGIDSAGAQADTDTSAADSAQTQSDNP